MERKIILILDDTVSVEGFASPYFIKFSNLLIHQEIHPQDAFDYLNKNINNIILILVDIQLVRGVESGFDLLDAMKDKGIPFKNDSYEVIIYSRYLEDGRYYEKINEYKDLIQMNSMNKHKFFKEVSGFLKAKLNIKD